MLQRSVAGEARGKCTTDLGSQCIAAHETLATHLCCQLKARVCSGLQVSESYNMSAVEGHRGRDISIIQDMGPGLRM